MNPVTSSLLPNTIRRDMWQAMPPKVIDFGMEHPLTSVLITYTETDTCSTPEECKQIVKALQEKDQKTLPDIKQSFIIGGDGNMYVGRGWISNPELPQHHQNRLNSMLYIGYIGRKGKLPPKDMTKVADDLIDLGEKNEYLIKGPKIFEETLL